MAVRYNGIQLTAPVASTAFTADTTIYGFDVVVTATAGPAFIVGANGADMAVLATGIPFRFGGTAPVTGEPLQLSLYQARAAAGNVHISFATRV